MDAKLFWLIIEYVKEEENIARRGIFKVLDESFTGASELVRESLETLGFKVVNIRDMENED